MQWTDLEPITKIVPRAQAAVYVNADGKPRVRLTLSEAFLNDIKHAEAANVQAGSDGTVAKIRLVFCTDGKFKITDLGRGGSRISNIPAVAPVPDGAREVEPCEVESCSTKDAIIILPLAAWAKQLSPSRPVVRTEVVRAEPLKPVTNGESRKHPDIPLSGGNFDAVAYLSNMGVKLSRIAGGFMEAGQKRSKADILTTVNRYRRAAELPDLLLADIA
jgi:hypothetical protein